MGGRKLALACIKQAVTDLVGVVEKNGRIGSERLGVQGRAELLAEVKDFFFGKYRGEWSFAYCCEVAELDFARLRKRIAESLEGRHPKITPGQKLKEIDVLAIRAALLIKEPTGVIAKRHGVSDSTIRKIRQGRRWKRRRREVGWVIIRGDARAIPLRDKCVQCVVTSPPYWNLRDYGVAGQIGLEKTLEEYLATLVGVFREVWRVLRNDGTLWLNLGDSYSHGGNGTRDPERWPKQSRNGDLPIHAKKNTGLKPKDLIGIPWRMAFALQGLAVVPFRSFSAWADELRAARRSQDWEAVEIVEHKLRQMDLLTTLKAEGWYLRSDIVWAKPAPMPESVTDRPTRSHEYVFLLSKSETYFYDAKAIMEPASTSTHARLS
jgi:hypothetical protein